MALCVTYGISLDVCMVLGVVCGSKRLASEEKERIAPV